MNSQRKAGFTLVEIMIVVAIVGLLAIIAIPSFTSARSTSMKNVCIDHLRQISGAKDQYALGHNGAAPTTVNDLVPEIFSHRPTCPAGGSGYTIGGLGTDPTCPNSALGHSI